MSGELSLHHHADHAVREFAAARARGDEDGMRRAWERLVTARWDFIMQRVAAQGYGMLSPTERDEALRETAMRLAIGVRWTFSGTTLAEFNAIVVRIVSFACLTEQRRAARWSSRTISLDERVSREDGAVTFGERADLQRVEHETLEDDDAEMEARILADGQAFLDWAVPQLSPKPREVFALLLQGYTTERVMRALGMQQSTVHQNSSRAMRQLRKLRSQYAHDRDRPDPH